MLGLSVCHMVCSLQLLEDGIAKRDGRLQVGDIVQKVAYLSVCLSVCLCGVTLLDVNNIGMQCSATLAYLWAGQAGFMSAVGTFYQQWQAARVAWNVPYTNSLHVVAYLPSRGLLQGCLPNGTSKL